MVATLHYARSHFNPKQIMAWGSAYSAAQALKLAGVEPALVDGVLAFAPGEYFGSLGKPDNWIRTSAIHIESPTFITSARNEKSAWGPIFEVIPIEQRTSYLPTTGGNHGSRTLRKRLPTAMAIGVRCGYSSMRASTLNRYPLGGLLVALPNENANFA